MGFKYKNSKSEHSEANQWSAYSDLFLTLSTIFLFLYVVASLRQGASGVQNQIEYKKLAHEVEDLRQQIRVYDSLRQNYLDTSAGEEEKQVYSQLMDKLDLLQDEAKEEKNELRQKALENEKKEQALNKYQQVIRNIINSNLIAQSRIKRRDNIIEEKNLNLREKQKEISTLEKSVAEKKSIIEKGERKIASINSELEKRVHDLREAYKKNEISKKILDKKIQALKEESTQKIAKLESQNSEISSQLEATSEQLSGAAQEIEKAKSLLSEKDQENSRLTAELEGIADKYKDKINELKGDFETQRSRERKDFEKALNAQKLSGEARAAREAEFKAAAERKAHELGQKLADLNGKVQDVEGQLQRARALANAKRALAAEIKKNFAKAGISADVDAETGDVLLDFGKHYFETGRSDLKPEMVEILKKAMPVYSESLFEDKKVAEKITYVEIIGFASPTYQGKYVDPRSLDPSDQKAVEYNLDLSYQRARSIFKYVFDTNKIQFKYQQKLLPLVKVIGRSFLAEAKKDGRSVASGATKQDFCSKNDCAQAQKVIIKFNLENRGGSHESGN